MGQCCGQALFHLEEVLHNAHMAFFFFCLSFFLFSHPPYNPFSLELVGNFVLEIIIA